MVTVTIAVSLPQELVARVDEERGDISRSKYIARLLTQAYDGDWKDQQSKYYAREEKVVRANIAKNKGG